MDFNVIFLFAALSLLSLIRGSVNYVRSKKRGHLGFVGQVLLAAYFLVCVLGRISVVAMVCNSVLLAQAKEYGGAILTRCG